MIPRLPGLPVEASAHAQQIDTIIGLVHLLMLVLVVGWGTFFIYTLVRFRRRRNPKAQYQAVRGGATTWTEAIVVLVELILLVGFSIPAWATRVRDLPSENEAVIVRVVAEQFAWTVHYPGPDGAFGATDIELVVADNPLGIVRDRPMRQTTPRPSVNWCFPWAVR